MCWRASCDAARASDRFSTFDPIALARYPCLTDACTDTHNLTPTHTLPPLIPSQTLSHTLAQGCACSGRWSEGRREMRSNSWKRCCPLLKLMGKQAGRRARASTHTRRSRDAGICACVHAYLARDDINNAGLARVERHSLEQAEDVAESTLIQPGSERASESEVQARAKCGARIRGARRQEICCFLKRQETCLLPACLLLPCCLLPALLPAQVVASGNPGCARQQDR